MDDSKAEQQINTTGASADISRSSPRYLTYKQLSEQTGFSVSTLRRRKDEGNLPYFQAGGPRKRIVFPADVVERCLQHSTEDSPSPEAMPDAPVPVTRRGPRPKWQQTSSTKKPRTNP
jgi:hypothetical protein